MDEEYYKNEIEALEEYYKNKIEDLRDMLTEAERRMQDEIDMRDEEIADLKAEIIELNNRY